MWTRRGLDGAQGELICASVLISPIACSHYLVLLFIPAAQVVEWLACRRPRSSEAILALVTAVLLLPSRRVWEELAFLVAGQAPAANGESALPTAAALLTLAPALGVVALGCLVAMLAPRRGADLESAAGTDPRPADSGTPGMATS